MVDDNIIKLSVKRLRDHLYSHAGEVQSLEKRKLQLDTVSLATAKQLALERDSLHQCRVLYARMYACLVHATCMLLTSLCM